MDGLTVSVKDGVKIIKFSRTERKNAVNRHTYISIANILNEDATNNDIVLTVITGEGDYFTSGNDMKAGAEVMNAPDPELAIKEANQIFKSFIQAVINYPKLLIAVINGPAIGIGVTIAGLCDVVYASDRATFHAPFIHLGLACEGCSSYMFPIIMGRSKASELLLLGKKITAQEAFECDLIARVVPHNKLGELFKELQNYGTLSVNSVLVNKKLVADGLKKTLHDCNNRECEALMERMVSEDFFNSTMKFMSRKSKL